MLQLKNNTPLKAKILPMPNPDGIDSLYTIIKATFLLGQFVKLAEEQIPIVEEDQYFDEPGTSSLKVPSDLSLIKPGTDVLLLGNAYAPQGKQTIQTDVTLNVGSITKTVRIFGDRVWRNGFLGAKISELQSFEKMPLIWEKAFGGFDQTNDKEPQIITEERNPVGLGFRVKNSNKTLDGMKLPNIEDPAQLISSWKDKPVPACFGPVCSSWEPRKSYAGTYDENWQKHRMPYLPKDFDSRFFQLVSPDQVVPGYLKGGEEVRIIGATPSGQLHFRLPQYRLQVTYQLDNKNHVYSPNLDTVIIEPDESRLSLLWRTVLPCDKKILQVSQVKVILLSGLEET
jgi:hypothetical protein